ncbi:MAG: helix-turn-helix domain-containing protein [Bacteroides sp.]|nr:helix-turn-helix domain-containing protein [Bacteroides sp.]
MRNYRNDNILFYYKIGGKIFYDESEIEAWLNTNYHPRY